MPGMPDMTRERFDRVPDPISARCTGPSDCLMSGPAVSGFKLPSLPRFDRKARGGEDPVMARSPRIRALTERDFRFTRGAKPKDRELPSGRFEAGGTRETWERRDRKTGALQRFDWDCGLPPDDAHFGLKADMPEYVETSRRGKATTFTWVTDLPLDRTTVRAVMRCARRRWAIENETFKTLKSGDAHSFERTCGHGDNHLRDVFGLPAMPAFPVDQIQRHCRGLFGWALKHRERSLLLRNDPGDLVRGVAFPDRETLYRALAGEVGFVPVRDGPWRQRRLRASSPASTLNPAKTVQNRPGQPLRTVAHARLKPAKRHVD